MIASIPKPVDGTKRHCFAVDPCEADLRPTGVVDFFDPVPRPELLRFRDALLPRVAAFGRTLTRTLDRHVVACCTGHLTLFSMRCFKASRIIAACQCRGLKIDVPERDFLTAFSRSDPNPAEAFAQRLLLGLPKRQAWKAPARILRNMLRRESILEREPWPIDLKNDIIVTSISRVLLKHAAAVDDRVVYCHPSRWFQPVRQDEPEANAIVRDGLMQSVRDSYAEVGRPFDRGSQAMVGRWLAVSPGAVQARLIGLESRPADLPRRLWVGTSAPIWSRTLSHAVRAVGGDVTGHDHGDGVGFLTSNLKSVNDFESVDRFLTFTARQAEGLMRSRRSDLIVRSDMPDIGVVPGPRTVPAPVFSGRNAAMTGKKVMLVTSFFTGSGVDFYPRESDVVRLDWYARLMTALKSAGFEIILKPHPECRYGVPPLLRSLADHVPDQRFLEVCDRADVLLYDYPLSSTFGEGLASSRPIVFICFDPDEFDTGAREMLARRSAIIVGRKLPGGRRDVEWSELMDAFARAPALTDPSYFEAYLAY